MTHEEAQRMTLGWSRDRLARVSNVPLASIYLLERMGSAGADDDLRIRKALLDGLAHHCNQTEVRRGLNIAHFA